MRQNFSMWHTKPAQSPCMWEGMARGGAVKCMQCCINVHACGTQSVFLGIFLNFFLHFVLLYRIIGYICKTK